MRRAVVFAVIVSVTLNVATPLGVAFALDEQPPTQETPPAEGSLTDDGAATEAAPEPTLLPTMPPTAAPTPALAPTVSQPVQPVEPFLPPQRKVYVSAFQTTNALGFIEVYNSDTKTQSVNGWKVVAEFSDGGPACEVSLNGYIFAKSRVLIKRTGTLPEATNASAHEYDCGAAGRVVSRITVYDHSDAIERLTPPLTADQFWARRNTTATYLTGDFTKDFQPVATYEVTDGFWYSLPPAPEIQILEVLVNPRSCLPSDTARDCYDFIKLKNTSAHDMDLSDYRLRSGFSNSASTSTNTHSFSVVLKPGEIRTLTKTSDGEQVSFSANDGTLWFEDAEGMIAYPTDVPPYNGSGLSSKQGFSWAYDTTTHTWRWAIPSPESETNRFPEDTPGKGAGSSGTELAPCAADQYRNPETNRCKKIESASTLKACKEGQYRSEETNRCRSIASAAASVLKPCADDQFRNPLTNRCKKIASAEEAADCGEGRERNPVTNRCRNIIRSDVPAAAFGVEPVKDSAMAFAGWWALGGIMALALGYAGWEWRHEIRTGLKRITSIRLK